MSYKYCKFLILLICFTFLSAGEKKMNIYDFKVKDINNNEISMNNYKNKVLLIVNVASKCGFTSQYEGLEELYEEYKNDGFMVLAFPSNEFSNQEPGTNEEIKEFCELTYKVKFDLFSKIKVNSKEAIPLYKYLKHEAKGIFGTTSIKWNFTKFLVSKEGLVTKRYSSTTKPNEIKEDIEALLKK